MLQTNRYVMAGISVSLALAIGFFMQGGLGDGGLLGRGDETAQRSRSVQPDPNGPSRPRPAGEDVTPSIEITGIQRTANAPAPRDPAPARLTLPRAPEIPASTGDSASETQPESPRDTAASSEDCTVEMTAEPTRAAMVDLSLTAPCQANAAVTIHHNGMMFDAVTDAEGRLALSAPALAEQSVFIAAFENSDGAVAMTTVPDLAQYDRVVLQWQGDKGVELHAMEFAEDYSGPGHVWAEASRNPEAAVSGEGGFITRLGDSAMKGALKAEVYTFPVAESPRSGEVSFSVEAEVTEANCGKDVEAQTIEVHRGATPRVQDVSLFIPDCDAVGDFLVLKNIIDDLTIASN